MASPYDKLLDMIKGLDLDDDGIRMNNKIKSIEQDFCTIIKDEQMLSDSMDYMNSKVLGDNDAALKFALLFSSRNFDSLAMNDIKVRCKMLNILQTNFSNAENYRKDDRNRLYNSITLLGEYYHRVRLADGSPISILCESLLGLLTHEINADNNIEGTDFGLRIDLKLAKLVLSQVTLNGKIIRTTHPNELNLLLYHVRKVLIEQPDLQPNVKALLLMTLDLYYSNFSSLSPMLEEMYTKYLVEEDKINRQGIIIDNTETIIELIIPVQENDSQNLENGNSASDELSESPPPVVNKKWSEQVCEDSMYESELGNDYCDSIENVNNDETGYQSLPPQTSKSLLIEEPVQSYSPISSTKSPENYKNNIRSPTPPSRTQIRPKHINPHHHQQQQQQHHPRHNNNNRYNQNTNRNGAVRYEDDRNSVRSEGGSIRLYSVEDRLRHSQTARPTQGREKWERGGGFHSNDGSRNRSTSRNSNFENGVQQGGGPPSAGYQQRNHQNNRHNYDRPPRFRNTDSSWRNNVNNSNTVVSQDNITTTEPVTRDSVQSTRSRTLPRNNRHGYFESYNGNQRSMSPDVSGTVRGGGNVNRIYHNESYHNRNMENNSAGGANMGHFPNHHQQPNRQQSRNFGRTNNQHYSNRYSSHSSLTSDSGAWERRGRTNNNIRRNNRGKSQDWEGTNGGDQVAHPTEHTWQNPTEPVIGDSEDIKDTARNTANYMQYLSQQ